MCVRACPTKAREMAGRNVEVLDVMEEVARDTVFYDESEGGVTFSGGEPFLQHIFLQSLLEASKDRGIHTAVETCGFVDTETLLRISRFVDLFLYDLKVVDDEVHRKFTGVSNEVIINNVRQLSQAHDHIVVRFPVIPGVNDGESSVSQMGELVSSLRRVREIDLLPYHPLGTEKYSRLGMESRMPKIEPPSASSMDAIANKLEHFVSFVKIGG
jgi:pyruvate formate lyase activating enzyme